MSNHDCRSERNSASMSEMQDQWMPVHDDALAGIEQMPARGGFEVM